MKTDNKPQHTQGEWKIEETSFEEINIYSGDINICTVLRQGELEQEGDANAQRIVKAVNMHDELVRDLTLAYKRMKREEMTGNLMDSIESLMREASQK